MTSGGGETLLTIYPCEVGAEDSGVDVVERFHELVRLTTSVRVVQGSVVASKRKNDKTLFVQESATALSELVQALTLRPLGSGTRWMTPGDPSLVLSDASGLLLTIQLLAGAPDFVRSDTLPEDAQLADPTALREWLAKYGEPTSS